MGKSREIKSRMKAVGNIQRITKTMQMIATAKFQASQRRVTEAKPYAQAISQLVGELGSAGGGVDHPLLRSPASPNGRELLLVLSSNRGLCGGYNANILRTAVAYLREHPDLGIDLEVVGKKAVNYFKFTEVEMAAHHSQFTDTPARDEVERLAQRYMDDFTGGVYDAVRVVYMAFHSAGRQSPIVLPLLPLEGLAGGGDGAGGSQSSEVASGDATYDFSPQPQELLAELLPIAVKMQLYQCFSEASVSEHIARMVAMKSATDSAGKMRKDLGRRYNRARQAAITTELSEIIAGSSALQ
jgi:F-type H+-transporting ATPase subunit gamma